MAGTMTLQAQSLTFEPPGPGVWERADMHHPRPVPRDWVDMERTGSMAGFRPWARRCGLLLDHFDVAAAHGFVYYRST